MQDVMQLRKQVVAEFEDCTLSLARVHTGLDHGPRRLIDVKLLAVAEALYKSCIKFKEVFYVLADRMHTQPYFLGVPTNYAHLGFFR